MIFSCCSGRVGTLFHLKCPVGRLHCAVPVEMDLGSVAIR